MLKNHMNLMQSVAGDYHCSYTTGMPYLHNHTHYEVSVIVNGRLTVKNNSDTFCCEGPCVILHFPGSVHGVICDESVLYERYNINFSAEMFRRSPVLLSDTEQLFIANVSLLKPSDRELEELLYYIKPLVDEKCSAEKRERLLAVILNVLCSCSRAGTVAVRRISSVCVNRAVVSIAEHLSPNITATELADMLGISRAKLTADFKRETGMTLKEYIELQCVERAKSSLFAGKSVQLTADELGYIDVGTFIRMFKKVTGETPGKYKHRIETII